ncbi:MAG: fumarylacetoacetate hydrolase family protein [Pseudomonadales bacterium]|nr:fumarylacetoacetate hydrolase family protein [Pseudomonadales bacterium]MDP6470546.1 fumarylacetoacetate hydrolase family protein [Pseudomonadales bacterium]MDP6827848.1 fumarylacetoacetate hydrolase family protein [Pseudomonadales bacterium]MDP6970563.1 fumarylacetoacetate hydrolase family protein [Pseudomonadales bacterium]
MRWLSFTCDAKTGFGFLTAAGDAVVDVTAHSDYADLKSAIAGAALERLVDQCAGLEGIPLDRIVYAPTITNPDKILCVGLNYRAHQEETGCGGEGVPTIFVRFANAQVGHEAPMVRPCESATLDYEGEIALIIGKAGRRIARADALDHAAGFGIYNDASVREFQRQTSQFTPGKNFAGTGGFGPWMMTPDEVGNLDAMEITTRLNGEVMQNAKASLLVHGFAELIEFCSTFTELVPGDVIVTGTPGGVGSARNPPIFMDEGDTIEVEVKPIGTLRNQVVVG